MTGKGRDLIQVLNDFETEITKIHYELARLEKEKKERTDRLKLIAEFHKDIQKRKQPKMSELYIALETNATTYWRTKEISLETRAGTFIEILVFKKYFFSVEQVKIIQNHFCLKYIKKEIYLTTHYQIIAKYNAQTKVVKYTRSSKYQETEDWY